MNRGGSWNNDASNCRVANRNNNTPTNTNNNLGFRVVLAAPAQRGGRMSFIEPGYIPSRSSALRAKTRCSAGASRCSRRTSQRGFCVERGIGYLVLGIWNSVLGGGRYAIEKLKMNRKEVNSIGSAETMRGENSESLVRSLMSLRVKYQIPNTEYLTPFPPRSPRLRAPTPNTQYPNTHRVNHPANLLLHINYKCITIAEFLGGTGS